MSIVVMDDDDAIAKSLVQRLNALGYDSTRGRADQLAVVDAADMFVLGFRDADSLAAMARSLARKLERVPAVLVALSAPTTKDLMVAMALGFTDVLPWPARAAAVSEIIERNIRRSRVRRANDPTLFQQVSDLEQDQRAGRYIQMGMLPPNPVVIDQYRLRHRIQPSLLLSGDFVDYFRITDEHFVFYMADVSGHGASSAFVTVILKNFSRRLRREYRPSMLRAPGEILVALNREILENRIDKHVAMFIGVVNLRTNELCYANGGHLLHAIHVHDGDSRLLALAGKPVGLFDEVEYVSASAELAEGDNLVLLSDGVLDVMPEAGFVNKESRLRRSAVECGADMDRFWSDIGIDATVAGPDDVACLMVGCEG